VVSARGVLHARSGEKSILARKRKPNFIIVLIDDLRFDELGICGHPYMKTPHIDRIGHEGAMFTAAFHPTPLCSPNRASILTGQYASRHGIIDNVARDAHSHRLPNYHVVLQKLGYETAHVGKWHMGNSGGPRPGYHRWVSFPGHGSIMNPVLNIDGDERQHQGYITDLLNAHAVEFLRKERDKPFALFFAHKAVHPDLIQYADGSVSDPTGDKFIPAERHKNLYADAQLVHRANYAKAPEGKPSLLRQIGDLPPLGPKTVTKDETIRNRLRMLASVEDGVADIFKTLESQKQLDNTLIIFTSDEGYFYGEHGLSVERRLAYEESIRIPLFMRWPKLIKAGSSIDQFALNIDITPTLLETGRWRTLSSVRRLGSYVRCAGGGIDFRPRRSD